MTFGSGWFPGADTQEDARSAMADNEAMLKEHEQAVRDKARLFYDVFANGRGPELLELLRGETIELDLMNVTLPIGSAGREISVSPSEWAYHRNGQNSVVRYIESMVRFTEADFQSKENDNA